MRNWRAALLIGLSVVVVGMMAFVPPIPQDQEYHKFADARRMLGVDNFLDTASNLPFVIFGAMGVIVLFRGRVVFEHAWERWPYVVMFAGVFLTGFGSAYYHEDPIDRKLFWDRLPLTLVFMSLFGTIITERVSTRVGGWLFLPLLCIGALSMIWWRMEDDLRLYALVQFYPIVAIPLMLVLFRSRYTRTPDILVALTWYASAKVAELLDHQIYDLGGVVSGHTLKHLLASMSAYWILRMIRRRKSSDLHDKSPSAPVVPDNSPN